MFQIGSNTNLILQFGGLGNNVNLRSLRRREGFRLLLVGGGHAHLEVLRRLALEPRHGLTVILISSYPRHHYSGMAPGYLAGLYRESQIAFDLTTLAQRAGAIYQPGTAVAIDPENKTLILRDKTQFRYDLVSFNIGSRTAGARSQCVKQAELVKPISRTVKMKRRLDQLLNQPDRDRVNLAVVGAGAAGVEVACALDAAAGRTGVRRRVTIVEAGSEILSGYSRGLREKAVRALKARGIQLFTGTRVARVEPDHLALEAGGEIAADLTAWVTGPEAPAIFDNSDLAVSMDGYLLVDDGLRSISDPRILAVGDCATMVNYPDTPKAGVYAVRQAPILWRSIVSSLEGTPAPLYTPQRKFLSILNLCDGTALLEYRGFTSRSRWAWRLKDWIDRRFVQRYQKPA